jgi:plastocyanin
MAHAGQAREVSGQPKTVLVKIHNDNTATPSPATANVGDTVEFHNEASTTKLVQFTDENGVLPIALEIPNGGKSEFLATTAGTVTYNITVPGDTTSVAKPADDGYQVIVNS